MEKNMENSSYPYRVERFSIMQKQWGLEKIHDLMLSYNPPKDLLLDLNQNIMLYISKAFEFPVSYDEAEFMDRLEAKSNFRENITPNGAVVPKKEYQLEFNLVLRSWTRIIKDMTKNNPSLMTKIRMTPNIRIKFGEDPKENLGRPLNTSIPHSDAWIDSSFGINCYAPLLGDIDHNNMDFYEPADPENFDDKFLSNAKTYAEMQWVLDYYSKSDKLTPQKGKIHLSDFAIIHGTSVKQNARLRVSLDTSVYVDDNNPHVDRIGEYMNEIQIIGEDLFVSTTRSINENKIFEKKTEFSHFTSGTLKILDCK
jgi:hypothetical protein